MGAVLRHAARIGDLREAGLGSSPEAAAARRWDGVADERQVAHALQLCCWINGVERRRFSPPYAEKDADAKHAFFLEHVAEALTPAGIQRLRGEWQDEYAEVMEGWAALQGGGGGSEGQGDCSAVHRHGDVGLAVLRPPRPLHYYSSFSHAIGCDVVATLLPGRRYEVECRCLCARGGGGLGGCRGR